MGAEGIVIGILETGWYLEYGTDARTDGCGGRYVCYAAQGFDVRRPDRGYGTGNFAGNRYHPYLRTKNTCLQGAELLKELETRSRGRITIQAGSGVGAEVIRQLYPLGSRLII